jgi:hypothetical protein
MISQSRPAHLTLLKPDHGRATADVSPRPAPRPLEALPAIAAGIGGILMLVMTFLAVVAMTGEGSIMGPRLYPGMFPPVEAASVCVGENS